MPPTVSPSPLPFGYSFSNIRTEDDRSQILNQDWRAVLAVDRHVFQISRVSGDIRGRESCIRAPPSSSTRPPTSFVLVSTRSMTVESGMP